MKLKIIDLINKVANNEKVPKYIKYNGSVYHYMNDLCDYQDDSILFLFEQTDKFNDEVEIVEEPQKIEHINKTYDLTKFYNDYEEPAIMLKDMSEQIKKIIDTINEKE